MKMLKRSLVWILAVITLLGAVPFTSFALIDTSDNDYVITKKTPSGKTGKSMSISFTLKNNSGKDLSKMVLSLSTDVIISDDEDLESTYEMCIRDRIKGTGSCADYRGHRPP